MSTTKTIDLWRRFRPTPSQEKFLKSEAFGRLFSSGYGCLGRGTKIYNPVSRTLLPIEDLTTPGWVQTLTGAQPRSASFLKGHAEMFAVTIDGQETVMSADHKMLTPEGWLKLRELAVGAPVACSSPLGAHHSTRTTQGCPLGCSPDRCRRDGRPLEDEAAAPAFFPSPADALERTRCCFCRDVLEDGRGRTRACPECGRLSNPGVVLPADALEALAGGQPCGVESQALIPRLQASGLSLSASSQIRSSGPLPTQGRWACSEPSWSPLESPSSVPVEVRHLSGSATAYLESDPSLAPLPSAFPRSPSDAVSQRAWWACIEKISPLGLQEVWDIHVPRVHHYIANGVVHANSGKSMTGCREAIMWCVKYPGCRGLIGRLVGDELKTTTMVTFWKSMATIGFQPAYSEKELKDGKGHYVHNKAERYIEFWNESRIYYRHLDDPDSLGSLELNFAFIDEGAEVDDEIYKTISSSRLRWHITGCDQAERVVEMIDKGASDEEVAAVECACPKGIWVCTNPGASGYLKAVTHGKVADWEWIPAKPGDNPYNGPDYYAKMERDRQINGDIWMKRYYEGDWTAFQGMRFPMFDRDRHILATEWRPTDQHEVCLGVDFGHVETFVAWLAFHPSRNEPVVVFHELQVNEVQEPREVADAVKRINADYGIKNFVSLGDPAGVGASQFSAVSPIAAYAGLGWFIAPCKAGKSPIDRANLLAGFLNETRRQPDGSLWPGIVFGPNCPAVVDSVLNLRWKDTAGRAGEDPREKFVDKNKHGFDGLSYALVGVPPPETPPARPRVLSGNQSIQQVLEQQGIA